MAHRAIMVVLVALFAVPGAHGALNGAHSYEDVTPYAASFEQLDRIVSGRLDAAVEQTRGASMFADTTTVTVDGLVRVCRGSESEGVREGNNPCRDHDQLSLRFHEGARFAVRFPKAIDITHEAPHALGFYVNMTEMFQQEDEGFDEETMQLGASLVSAPVNGTFALLDVPVIAKSALIDHPDFQSTLGAFGVFVTLDASTRVDILEAGEKVDEISGEQELIAVQGAPVVSSFQANVGVLPFTGASAISTWVPANASAAAEGLRLSRINDIQSAFGASGQGGELVPPDALGSFEGLMQDVFDGAVLGIPQNATEGGSFVDDFLLVRFDSMTVAATASNLQWEGEAPLAIQGTEVEGASELVGFWYFMMPWWSYLLWVVAIGLFVARIVTGAPKKNEQWDRFKVVGWIFGLLAFLMLFWLWDGEVERVWGASILSGGGTGQALLLTAAIQMMPFFYVLFAVAAPLRLALKSGSMLAKQGTFMGLSTGVSYILAYFLGAGLLLAYIEFVMERLASAIA